jgi:hemolysin activation/secretion protein
VSLSPVARLLLAAALVAQGAVAHAQDQTPGAAPKPATTPKPADPPGDDAPPAAPDGQVPDEEDPEPAPAPKFEPIPQPPPPPEPSRTAGPDEVAPGDDDGNPYLVARVALEYAQEHPENPPVDGLMDLKVVLTPVPEGYVAARRGCPVVVRRIGDLGVAGGSGKPEFLYGSALRAIGQAVVREMTRRGLIVVFIEPHPDDIDALSETQDDLRLHPETDPMRLVIRLGAVKQIRTIAAGDRRLKGERIDNPAHESIRRRSPLKEAPGVKRTPQRPIRSPEEVREAIKVADQKRAAEAGREPESPAAEAPKAPAMESAPEPATDAAPARGSLIRRDKLDDFVSRLNRHPGRRVDVAVAPADADSPGDVLVDYLVNENNPWTFYAQLSNTGTENTDEWRERLGFSNTQLTGRDDILRLDFITAGFEDTLALIGSYEFPIFSDTLRGRLYGSASEFKASDVGLGGENFDGKGWTIGGEAIWNFFQRRELFIDAVAGFRAQRVGVRNEILQVAGNETFFIPYAGLRLNRDTEASSIWGALTFEANMGNPSEEEVANLGRAEPDTHWNLLQYDVGTSFYIEPLLFPDARTPESGATLAHEMAFSLHGQWAFGNRLIPNVEDIAGGLSTVRGYPESLVAGDSTMIGTAEYRFHLPRAMGVEVDPTRTPLFGGPFRARPQQAYGQADWDLILKGFIDAARVVNSERKPFESNETLVGTGVGAELQLLRNFSFRVDWGVALTEVEGGDRVTAGSNRFHISLTLLF